MLIFFWQYGGEADESGAPPVTPSGRIYSVHRSKGLSICRGVSRSKRNVGLSLPEASDDS